MSKLNKFLYFIFSLIFFSCFDIYFSALILNFLRFNFEQNKFIDLIYIQNTGAAFSILENSQPFLILFFVFTILFLVVFVIKNIQKNSLISLFWLSMLISGIGCNLYERICYGYVRDFFKLNFIEFPVFNISDIFINISVIALVILILKKRGYFKI